MPRKEYHRFDGQSDCTCPIWKKKFKSYKKGKRLGFISSHINPYFIIIFVKQLNMIKFNSILKFIIHFCAIYINLVFTVFN